jgi:demethoxyubiquinone hydroxylase (CLK1/Coq7/Cat5 family)
VAATGAVEVYRVQARAADSPNIDGLLRKLGASHAGQAEDLGALIRRHGGRPLPMAGLTRGIARLIGRLTSVLGTRVALRFDVWLEEREVQLYERAISLLPPEEGITARALQAMQGQQERQVQMLRDHLRALRPSSRARR